MVRGEKAQRFVIGTAAEVARLLEITPAASARIIGSEMDNVMYTLAQQVTSCWSGATARSWTSCAGSGTTPCACTAR
jgi:hypothetical protein